MRFEEACLLKRYGEAYIVYYRDVRRWVSRVRQGSACHARRVRRRDSRGMALPVGALDPGGQGMHRSIHLHGRLTSPFLCAVSKLWPSRDAVVAQRASVAALTGLLLSMGCTTVDPKPDFQRVSEAIVERIGADGVYVPGDEALVQAKVTNLLADGLTVDEAVAVALLNNRAFQSMFHEIGVSRAEVVQSGLLTNPSLSFGLRFPESGGRSEFTFGLVQRLVDLWQIPVRKSIAEAKLEQTVMQVAHQASELAAQVRRQCYRLLAMRRIESVTHEDLDLLRRTFALVEKQVQAGQVSLLDASLVAVTVKEANVARMSIERDRELAQLQLRRTLGLMRAANEYSLVDTVPSWSLPPYDEHDWLAFAITERLDARVAHAEVAAAEEELKREYLLIFPDVALGVGAERSERRSLPGRNVLADTTRASLAAGQLTAPTIQSRTERGQARRQIIDFVLGPSIQVTLPLWHQNQPQIAKARYRVTQAHRRFEDLLDTVAEEVQRAFVSASSNAALVVFYEEQLIPQARQNVEGARRLYEAGEQSILVLIDAQRSLIQQRAAYEDVLHNFASAMVDLELAVGGRMPDVSISQPESNGANP